MIAKAFRWGRNLAGVLLKDWWRFERALRDHNDSYLALCNRNERLEASPKGRGFRCDWQWTSDLHATKYLPSLGLRLMRRAFGDHPVRRLAVPVAAHETPDISFVIGHRGEARLPHLLATIESIAGQEAVSFECLVVEQDKEAKVAGHLPGWVRYIHAPPPNADMPYCRSWAFNLAANQAHGSVLILHDNDMLVPSDYAANVLEHIRSGHEVVNLKRFIFFLGQSHTNSYLTGLMDLVDLSPETIMQNSEGGGSIAITREGYDRIGGMDEGFIGWGGEDNEFWERAQTLKVWPYAYLPLWHLWHAAQPGKYRSENAPIRRYQELSIVSVQARIAQLSVKSRGEFSGPAGWRANAAAKEVDGVQQ